jgi:hypothetical protein
MIESLVLIPLGFLRKERGRFLRYGTIKRRDRFIIADEIALGKTFFGPVYLV